MKTKAFNTYRFITTNKVSLMCIAILGLTMSLGSCDNDSFPHPPPPYTPATVGKAQLWLTLGDKSKLLSQETDIAVTDTVATTSPVIAIDAATKYQQIEGFGAALTGSSAYLINEKMTTSQRNQLLYELFDPINGIGISYLRTTIGASDFSLSDYTYDDMPAGQTDYDLQNFSIAKETDVIPVLQKITSIVPGINIMGSPWSPPAWMKTSGSMKGGKLKTDAYDAYAQYFVKYIQAFKNEGITISAITPQNEPLYYTAGYPCTDMNATEQLNFIKNSLGPAFQSAGLSTKIVVYDHNWDHPEYATTILADAAASAFIAGSAFHAYGGNVAAMSSVHDAFPNKDLYFTEISGTVGTDFSADLQWNMANVFIGTTKNWSKTALMWNLALDQSNGPTNNGCTECRGVVTINNATGAVSRNVEYYAIGHFAKFVRPGAYRIKSTVSADIANVDHVAFINTDNTKVIVVSNNDAASKNFVVKDGQTQFTYSIPAKSVATIMW